jgi:hypothetical protein
MKTKNLFSLLADVLSAVLFNAFIGGAFAFVLGVPLVAGAATVNFVYLIPSMVKMANPQYIGTITPGLAFVGLGREVYLAELMKRVRANHSFLAEARDLSAYVQNEAINLADAGADPEVILDYDHVDPLDVTDGEDNPLLISLRSFSTTRSKVTESETDTRAYAIVQDKTQRHAETLMQAIGKYSAHAFAPAQNSDFTPVLETSGSTVSGYKILSLDDVIALNTAMHNLDAEGKRILVLNPTHLGNLQKEDKALFKSFTPEQLVQGFPLFDFKCYVTTSTPTYKLDGGVPKRKAYGAVAESGDLLASFAFIANEVGRATGSLKVFMTKDDPTYQATFFSARQRFLATKMRDKYVAAIVQKAA